MVALYCGLIIHQPNPYIMIEAVISIFSLLNPRISAIWKPEGIHA